MLHKIRSIFMATSNIQKQPPEVFYKKGVLKNFTKFTEKAPVPECLFGLQLYFKGHSGTSVFL